MFGQPNAAKPGGLFGSTTQPAQGSSIFDQAGQTGQTGTGTGAGLGSSLFSNTGGNGLFGQQNQQNQQNQQPQQQQTGLGSSLFGNNNQQQPQQQNGLFGGFGEQSTTNQPQQGGIFGSTSQQPSLFGSTATNPMAASTNTTGYGQQAKPELDIGSRIAAVKSAWDPSSPDCRFKVSGSAPNSSDGAISWV